MKDKTNKLKVNYRFFLSYLKYCKAYVLAAFVAVGIFIASSAYLPTITASVINADLVNMPGLKDFLIKHALLFLGTAFLFFLSMYVKTLLFRKIANTVCEHIQMDMAGHLLNLKMKHFDEMTSGNIMSRFSSDVNAVGDLYFLVLGEVFSVILLCIVLYIRLAFMSPYLFGASFAYLPVVYFLARYYLKKSDKPTRDYRNSIGELNGFFNESINSIESVQAFCAEEKIEKEFDKFNLPAYTSKRKMVLLSGLFSWNIIARIRTLIYAALLGVFGYLYFQGAHFLVGTLVIAISYNKEITDVFLKLFMQINIYKNAFVAAGRVSEIINFEHERTNGTPHSPLGDIKFSNTKFEYKEGIPILKGLDFNAEDGMTIAFVGKTGCGKSTIMNLILGFYENSGGKVLIDGQDIRSLELKTLRSKIAVVLQEPYLFSGTIFDNISLNDPFINRESCEKALKAVGGTNLIERSKKGLDAEVSENGKNFSEGERQIICFARAMVRDPKILILDEATANIDTETEKLINAGIEVLKKGRTTLIIAHRLSTVKNADIINVIDDGKLLESGTHEELIALNSKYAEWYRLQK
ncbi:ABC transporter ATP-binding protein [Treponema denticola]|uniref:ABC transporter ATP-binding protein n=1 Tax=Treponema denticola TaxID=158 RepID=UPI0020A31A49|nr:ABC transporter ATP-binding protein [Treponema denticola]UTC81954.1 ABC transporter ATP-binding protein [Treponema denticola]